MWDNNLYVRQEVINNMVLISFSHMYYMFQKIWRHHMGSIRIRMYNEEAELLAPLGSQLKTHFQEMSSINTLVLQKQMCRTCQTLTNLSACIVKRSYSVVSLEENTIHLPTSPIPLKLPTQKSWEQDSRSTLTNYKSSMLCFSKSFDSISSDTYVNCHT